MLSFFLEKLFGANCTVIQTQEKERKREKDMPDSLKVRMIKGPAKVIVKGACHVLGSDVSGQIVKVRAGKALPFEPSNRWCRVHARLGHGARVWWQTLSKQEPPCGVILPSRCLPWLQARK